MTSKRPYQLAADRDGDQMLSDLLKELSETEKDQLGVSISDDAPVRGEITTPIYVSPSPANPGHNARLSRAPTPTVALVTASVPPLCSDDRFPVSDASSIVEHHDPDSALAELCLRVSTPSDYRRERVRWAELSVQLNLLQRRAPAFRPPLEVKAVYGDAVHLLRVRDELVIDYHWCYARRMEVAAASRSHGRLFAPGCVFSFPAAWELSKKNWRGTYRGAEALAMTTFQQCQTVRLRGTELLDRVENIEGGYRASKGRKSSLQARSRQKIGEWSERRPRRGAERSAYQYLWLARELLGPDHMKMIPELLALMLGESVKDRKTIKGKLVLLDKHVVL